VAHEPTDPELAEYIARRLVALGQTAEPEFVAELIAHNRDIWVLLFRVDYDLDGLDLDNPPFAKPS
jgi:hypothetical protein